MLANLFEKLKGVVIGEFRDPHQLLIDAVKRDSIPYHSEYKYLLDYVNIARPDDPNYLSPLHIAILKGNHLFVRRLLQKRANIIYHATPELRRDLLHVAINNSYEEIARDVFLHGAKRKENYEIEDDLTEEIASIIAPNQGSTKLSDPIQYLEPAIDNQMWELVHDILNTTNPSKLANNHKDANRLLHCLTKALQHGYSSIASEMITTLPYEMAKEYLYNNINIIPEELVANFLTYHGHAITEPSHLFNLLVRANYLNTAFSLATRIPDLDAKLVGLINDNAPVSELLLEKAISHGLRNATKLLLNKKCPGSEKALRMCINHSQENMACELITNGHKVNAVYDNKPLWEMALNKGLNNVVKSMIHHGLDLNSTPILYGSPGENIVLTALRQEKWDIVHEIIKTKPPIEYIHDALNAAHKADNTLTLDKILNLIITLSSDEAMTPYVEALLCYVSDLQPSHTLYIGKALHEANLPHLAYPLLASFSLTSASVEDYRKAQSICGHIQLANCPDNETDEGKENRIDACVEHLVNAGDARLTKFLYKDLYTRRQSTQPTATTEPPAQKLLNRRNF